MPTLHDAELCPDRRLIEVTGTEAIAFLQGLVTNDLRRLDQDDGLIWAALLTPQGKYLADFLIARSGGRLLIDLPEALAKAHFDGPLLPPLASRRNAVFMTLWQH